ncbi:hypothetical protein K7X08_017663 [Anisodus acutangulus]|uniref:UBX domain-containing protein n=1 Tax=Anisodus acutangulus TaxID=402998 RepID=A0A9Q1LY63_9SOLA|nr:hypothetical protein K7X08_017663 [Anisodus acutangulus]
MLVQDPSKHNDVNSIFDRARQVGAPQGPLETVVSSSSSTSFTGPGRTLAGETVPTSAPQPPESIVHNIIFWRNGFTSITKSECPRELAPADSRSQVHCNLIRRDENCPERQLSFQGVGRTLGSSSTPATSEPSASAPTSTTPATSTSVLDESLPSTSLQIRLVDGTRMVTHFNFRLGDIRAFLDASRPSDTRAYQLQTVGFLPKILSEPTQTIE